MRPTELDRSTHDAVWRLLRGLGCDSAAAEELTQETFLRAVQRAAPVTRAWLFTVARNLFVDRCRRSGRQVSVQWTQAVEAQLAACLADDDAQAEWRDAARRCVATLAPRALAIVTMFYREDRSRREVAAALGMTEAGVKTALQRARGAQDLHRGQSAMHATEDDLFDAKLRALLGEPERAPAPAPMPALDRRRRAVQTLTVAAALLVLLGLWLVTGERESRGPAAPQDPRPQDARPQDARPQDPRPTAPAKNQLDRWLGDLRDPAKREAATTGLVAAGPSAAAFLVEWLAQQDPDRLDPATVPALRAIARLGPDATAEIPALRKLVGDWSAADCVELLYALGTLAAWKETRIAQRGMSATSLDLDGKDKAIPNPRVASVLFRVTQRLDARADIGADTSAAALERHLQGSMFARDAALDVLLRRGETPPRLAQLAERILYEEQLEFDFVEWDADGRLREAKVGIEPVLRVKAAALLARGSDPQLAASGHAWRLQQPGLDANARREAALALGRILSRPEHRTARRHGPALAALVAAARDRDLTVAGDAVTALGQIGEDAPAVVAALRELAKHDDAGLAQRAAAALAAVRR